MPKKCQLFRVPDCLKMDMYRIHWTAAASKSSDKTDFLLVLRYLGLPCIMATLQMLASAAIFLSPPWMLDSPWWRVTFYWGLVPRALRSHMMVLVFYFSLLGSLGQGYEILHASRKIKFMRFMGPPGERSLTRDELARFRRFTRHTIRCINWTIFNYYSSTVVCFYGSALISGAWEFNRFWLLFWLIFWVVYLPSSYYVPVAMPTLLFIVVHYLRLIQKRLEVATKRLITARDNTARFGSVVECYRRLVARYVAFNRQLTSISHFWAFYLWLYMTIFPSMVVYGAYAAAHTPELLWICLCLAVALIFASLLSLIVYLCGSVRKGNRRISRSLASIYRLRIERGLVGNICLHLHLESMLHNVTLTDYAFRTINHQVIGPNTYFSLAAKFVFVYLKLLSNKNFK